MQVAYRKSPSAPPLDSATALTVAAGFLDDALRAAPPRRSDASRPPCIGAPCTQIPRHGDPIPPWCCRVFASDVQPRRAAPKQATYRASPAPEDEPLPVDEATQATNPRCRRSNADVREASSDGARHKRGVRPGEESKTSRKKASAAHRANPAPDDDALHQRQ
jgi:hypothetical protein